MAYRDYIEGLKREWCGEHVWFEGVVYTVMDVDYNGALLIDKPARFTETTAVSTTMVEKV